MQSYTEVKKVTANLDLKHTPKTQHNVRDVTTVLLMAALTAAAAIQIVKGFGLANGMDEHTRMTLSCVGFSICFVAAPTFVLFGRQMSIRTGLILGTGVIFVACFIASLIV